MKHTLLFLLILGSVCLLPAQHDTAYVEGAIFLKLKDTCTLELDPYTYPRPEVDSVISNFGITGMVKCYREIDTILDRTYRIECPAFTDHDSLISAWVDLGIVEYAERVPKHYISYIPDDVHTAQYYLDVINAFEAWDVTTGNPAVTVAVVDNGVFYNHNDLFNNRWINLLEIPNNGIDEDLNEYADDIYGYDVAEDDPDPSPPTGVNPASGWSHGTHVAGIIAASTDNGIGMASLGFNTRFISVKAAPDTGDGRTLTHAFDGVYYAMRTGAAVINMSFGGPHSSSTGQNLMRAARNMGIVLIAAAGNSGDSLAQYPAAYDFVIAVGATNQNDNKASFSNYGSYVDVMAPGVSIFSTVAGQNQYGYLSGTSMAAPLVAGLAALLVADNPVSTPSEIEVMIEDGADDIYGQNPQYLGQLGAGRIDAAASLGAAGQIGIASSDDGRISIYPNPASDFLILEVPEPIEGAKADLMDVSGKIVAGFNIEGKRTRLPLQGGGISPGLYFLRLHGTDTKEMLKVVVK